MKLIEKGKLTEKEYNELLLKLAIQFKYKDEAVFFMSGSMKSIKDSIKSKKEKMKAIGLVVEEFVAKIIAETIVRGSRGY